METEPTVLGDDTPASLILEIEEALNRADRARTRGARAEEIGHWTTAQLRAEALAEMTRTADASRLAFYVCQPGHSVDRAYDLLDRVRVACGEEEQAPPCLHPNVKAEGSVALQNGQEPVDCTAVVCQDCGATVEG